MFWQKFSRTSASAYQVTANRHRRAETPKDRRRAKFGPIASQLEEREFMDQAQKLRDLANWYRKFAERAENPAIWDARLRTAEDLEREAGNLEHRREQRLAQAL